MNLRALGIAFLRAMFVLLLVGGWVLQPAGVALAAGPWYVRIDGNDTECNGLANVSYPGGAGPLPCAYATITKAISSASAGDIIYIGAGTFDETPMINTALTLDGAGAGVTYIQPTSGTNIITINVSNIIIRDLSLDGGAGVAGSGILDNTITPLTGIVIEDCEISNLALYGISFSNVSFTANRNNIANNTSYGINSTVGGAVTLYRNSIQMNARGVNFAAGTLTATENVITDNSYGFSLGGTGVTATVQMNDLSNNSTRSLFKSAGSVVDASLNWWGSTSAATVRTQANSGANADYTPWLNSGTDTNLGTAGFQPGYSTLWVDDDSLQVGATGRIQEAITAVSGGGLVNVAAGTYAENVILSKAATLTGLESPLGANAAMVSGAVSVTAANATVKMLKVSPGAVTSGVAAISVSASGVSVLDNVVDGLAGNGSASVKGIYIYGGAAPAKTGIVVARNIVQNISNTASGSIGIMVQGVLDGVDVTQNTISQITAGGWAYGIEISPTASWLANPPQNVSIENNTLDIVNPTYGPPPYPGVGVIVDVAGPLPGTPADASQVTVFGNSMTNIPVPVFSKDPAHVLNASGNYLGMDPEVLRLAVNMDPVDYTPWLASGTDTSTNAGFQGDFSSLWITHWNGQSGATGRLAEAVGLVTSGGEVTALSGAYAEASAIAKSVKLTSSGGAAVFTQLDLNAGANIDPTSSGVTAGIVNINANTVTIADGILLAADNAATQVNINAAGTYAESVTINKSLMLVGNTTGIMANNTRIIDPPSGNAILVDGSVQVLIRGLRLTGATNGLRVANGAAAAAHGNTIDTVDTAFRVAFGSTLTAYANNVLDFTTGIVPDGTVNARHNWWDAINPANVGQADANSYRLGADVMSYNSATGGADASLLDTLASANATLSGGGAGATRVIINHGHLLPNVPFGKGQAMFTDTEPPCADFYDMFVINGTGPYSLGIPVKTGVCQDNAALSPHVWRMALINTDQPDSACDASTEDACWDQLNGSYSGGIITISGLTNADLAGTPFVPSNEGNNSPTAIQLVELTAKSGLGMPAALLLVSLVVGALLAGVLIWKRNK